jgi:C-mannosyltransferase DPY19L
MAVLLLQGNDMLKSSLYTSFFIAVSAYCLFFSNLRIKVQNRLDFFVEAWLVALRIGIALTSAVYLKKIISDFLGTQEDSHIWDLLFSKFSSEYSNFHTLLYTCSSAYNFLPMDTILDLSKTTLIPIVLLSIALVANRWIQNGFSKEEREEELTPIDNQDDEDSGIENADSKLKKRKKQKKKETIDKEAKDEWLEFLNRLNVEPDVFYCVAQLFVYGVMAGLVMRLKLLFVTQLCIVSGLLVNTKYYK